MSLYTIGKSAGKSWLVRCLGALLHRCKTHREAELTVALHECVSELQRLREVLLPHYEGKIGEPDVELLERARVILQDSKVGS